MQARSPTSSGQGLAKIMQQKRSISETEQYRRAQQRAMNLADFCARYGIGRTKTYEELRAGRLRGRKIGKRTIIAEDDAEDWLRSLPPIKSAR